MRWGRDAGLILAAVALWGCSGRREAGSGHEVHGKLMAIAADRSSVTVEHDEIEGLMPAMTMEFPLASGDLVDGVSPGAEVQMRLETEPSWRITALRVLATGPPPPTPDPRAKVEAPPRDPLPGEPYYQVGVGQRVPDFELIDQTGQPVGLAAQRGKAVVLTFIYTRCPMPDFCPLVTRRMVELQHALGPEMRERTRILMVTIDPKHDTPEILDQYARKSGLELGHASLLTGPIRQVALLSSYFGLEFWDQKDGTINHKVRLLVIDPQGRLHAELHGNTWTTERVLELLHQSLAESGG
jgi:protein SCO1